ncbi:MAG: RNA methyltransferase [Candidatus Sumerlaeaceae bacterium]
MPRPVYAALIHYPVVDKHGHLVSTSITNLDIHDISRSARTYGLAAYYLVTPIEAQHWLTRRILEHWETGWGSTYNPNRTDALSVTRLATDLGALMTHIREETGSSPLLIGTSARRYPSSTSFPEVRAVLSSAGPPVCLLFGTGWGLHPEMILECDLVLEPISGLSDFNHLSVRAAAAIIFDRLLAASSKEDSA